MRFKFTSFYPQKKLLRWVLYSFLYFKEEETQIYRGLNNLFHIAWPIHVQSKYSWPLLSTTSPSSKAGNWRAKRTEEEKFWTSWEETGVEKGLKEGSETREDEDLISDAKPLPRKDLGPGVPGGLPVRGQWTNSGLHEHKASLSCYRREGKLGVSVKITAPNWFISQWLGWLTLQTKSTLGFSHCEKMFVNWIDLEGAECGGQTEVGWREAVLEEKPPSIGVMAVRVRRKPRWSSAWSVSSSVKGPWRLGSGNYQPPWREASGPSWECWHCLHVAVSCGVERPWRQTEVESNPSRGSHWLSGAGESPCLSNVVSGFQVPRTDADTCLLSSLPVSK